jgi:hypothetical protein
MDVKERTGLLRGCGCDCLLYELEFGDTRQWLEGKKRLLIRFLMVVVNHGFVL